LWFCVEDLWFCVEDEPLRHFPSFGVAGAPIERDLNLLTRIGRWAEHTVTLLDILADGCLDLRRR